MRSGRALTQRWTNPCVFLIRRTREILARAVERMAFREKPRQQALLTASTAPSKPDEKHQHDYDEMKINEVIHIGFVVLRIFLAADRKSV